MDEIELENVETQSHELLWQLIANLPGDLGVMARAIVGGDHVSTGRPSDLSNPAAISAANPLPWTSWVLALCCRAYNQPLEYAIPVAACLELLGIASVVLDAAQDGHKEVLRGYAEGVANQEPVRQLALISNMGTALSGLAWQALLQYGPRYHIAPPVVLEIGQLLAERLLTICYAQHQDLTIGRSWTLTLGRYEEIVEGKAGVIGGTVCEAGAILAGASGLRSRWYTLGKERTIAHQLCDDYLDLEADLATGQQISHPVLYALQVADPVQRRVLTQNLERVTAGAAGDSGRSQSVLPILLELDAPYYTVACLSVHRQQAFTALQDLALPPPIHQWLAEWILRTTPLAE